MRLAGWIALLAAALLGGFAWWGIKTVAGRRRFDEMAGMVPWAAAAVAVVLAVVGVGLLALAWSRAPAR